MTDLSGQPPVSRPYTGTVGQGSRPQAANLADLLERDGAFARLHAAQFAAATV